MPSAPMTRTCGKCTWVSTKPGQQQRRRAGRRRRLVRVRAAATSANGPAVDDRRRRATSSAGVGLGAQRAAGERVVRGVEDRCRGRASSRRAPAPRSRLRARAAKARSRSAATLTAMVAGSLPVMLGQPDRRGDPVDRRRRRGPSAASRLRNRAHFADEPISPIEPRWPQRSAASQSATSSAWSWVMISTWVPGGSSPSTSSGSTGTWWTCTRRHARRRATREPLVGRAARRGSRPGAARGRAGPGSGPARARRARPRRSPPPARPAAARAARSPRRRSTARRARSGALSERRDGQRLRRRAAPRRAARAGAGDRRLPRGCRRRSSPSAASRGDDHLGAGLARARARARSATRDQHAGLPRRRAAARPPSASPRQASLSGAGRSDSGCTAARRSGWSAPAGQPSRRARVGAAPRLLDRPEHRLGRGRARPGRRWCPAGRTPRPPARSASRTAKASISGGSPTALEP